jgi:pimeloyl-ACP methyl ester carboxylesterase
MKQGLILCFIVVACFATATAHTNVSPTPSPTNSFANIRSKDGTLIAVECAGTGPSLVIVHGGTGDRTRWKPLFSLFASHFTVCAMDRRGHGASSDSPDYTLQKEVEDVAAVVNSRPGTVFVLGHSYGAVCALEAAFLTDRISKLVLYEPPLQDLDHSAVADRMEKMIQAGDREQATMTFFQQIVMISPSEIAAMKTRPSWPPLVTSIGSQIRQLRALTGYRFDPKRMSTLNVPTLLLTGSETSSPQLKLAINSLMQSLPNRKLVVFEGQQHNAMETVPEKFANTVSNFLLSANSNKATNQPKPIDEESLRGYMAGEYDLVGRKPDSTTTYTGHVTLRDENGVLQVTRTIDGKTDKSTARFDTVAGSDRIPVLCVHFRFDGKEYDATYRWQSDPDNYPRLTGCVYVAGTKSAGLEALFPIHK